MKGTIHALHTQKLHIEREVVEFIDKSNWSSVLFYLQVLDKESDEFSRIREYVKNTHAATHQQYDLEVEEVGKLHLIQHGYTLGVQI